MPIPNKIQRIYLCTQNNNIIYVCNIQNNNNVIARWLLNIISVGPVYVYELRAFGKIDCSKTSVIIIVGIIAFVSEYEGRKKKEIMNVTKRFL